MFTYLLTCPGPTRGDLSLATYIMSKLYDTALPQRPVNCYLRPLRSREMLFRHLAGPVTVTHSVTFSVFYAFSLQYLVQDIKIFLYSKTERWYIVFGTKFCGDEFRDLPLKSDQYSAVSCKRYQIKCKVLTLIYGVP